MAKRQVIWLNGAFGSGKTTVARKLAALESPRFATHLTTDHRTVDEVAASVLRMASV